MSSRVFYPGVVGVLVLLLPILFIACGGSDSGLSRAEVEEIVRAEMAETPALPQPEPGLTAADVEEAIRKVMADMPQQEADPSRSEVEQIVLETIAAIPERKPG